MSESTVSAKTTRRRRGHPEGAKSDSLPPFVVGPVGMECATVKYDMPGSGMQDFCCAGSRDWRSPSLGLGVMDAPALGRLLGAGNGAEVFAFGDGALKLYSAAATKRSAFREAANAAVAESLGLPVPKIHGLRCFGDRWGILMSVAEGPSFAESIKAEPNLTSAYLMEMA